MNTITNTTKAGILALLLCLAFAALTLKLFSPPKAVPSSAPNEVFSAERAMQHLKVIAKEPHSLGTVANEKVITYLVQELNKLGLEVTIQDTLVSRSNDAKTAHRISRVQNIIGKLKGTNNSKAVLLMAHHDSQPNTPGAADDGSGVVSILESVRAIKASGPLQNDLIVLITDAEEIGLMGAKAFVDFHPMLKEVGLLINLEARGNYGVSMSFEMNPENGWIVREFAKAAPYPFASSMAYEVYKIMPNDTDFSMFRETEISGVNSATVEGLVHYHSMTDTPENMSQDLLQHHGSNMLGMAQHFGNLNLENTKAPDVNFFNPIGSSLIIYPAQYDMLLMILTVLLFIGVIIIGIRKKQVDLVSLFTGTGYFLVVLTLAGIGSFLLQFAILKFHPHYTAYYANSFYNVDYYFIAFTGFAGFIFTAFYGYQKKSLALSLSLGGVLMLVMAMFGLTLSLPTGTYVLYYPLIIYLSIQLLLLFLNITPEDKPFPFAIGQFVALLPALGLWSQTAYLLFETFGLSLAIIAPVLLFSFLVVLLIPLLSMISSWKKRVLNILAAFTFFFGLIGGFLTSNYTIDQPLQTHLVYGLDADKDKAVWATSKPFKNEWMSSLIPAAATEALDGIYPTQDWKVWQSPAPLKSIAPSNITVANDTLSTVNDGFTTYNIQFSTLVNSMEFFLEGGSKISDIKINGFALDAVPNQKDDHIYFNYFAPPIEGFTLSLKTENEQQKIRVVDRIIGLPTDLYPSPMPDNMIHGPGAKSNVILVKKTYEF